MPSGKVDLSKAEMILSATPDPAEAATLGATSNLPPALTAKPELRRQILQPSSIKADGCDD